jgi:hypothetical protein
MPKMYSHHSLPNGARPVPKNEEGHIIYQGWDPKEGADLAWVNVSSGANKKVPFPNERKAQLDYELLGKLGVNRNSIIKCDSLLFYSLVLPLGDPEKKNWKAE